MTNDMDRAGAVERAARALLEMLDAKRLSGGGWPSNTGIEGACDRLDSALAHPPAAPATEAKCCCGEPLALGVVHRKDGPCYHATPAERAAAGFHDAGGVGEEKAREVDLLVRVEEFLRAAYVTPGARYVRDIAGVSSLLVMLKHARNGGDDPRRGESGEAIKAQGGAL